MDTLTIAVLIGAAVLLCQKWFWSFIGFLFRALLAAVVLILLWYFINGHQNDIHTMMSQLMDKVAHIADKFM